QPFPCPGQLTAGPVRAYRSPAEHPPLTNHPPTC
ncbi:MAG: hypothetical protein QOG05_5516, partial [Streptosporangiaceae bacterium]|nr:hypothetical protein [Streptosporangiaceae bacterium]